MALIILPSWGALRAYLVQPFTPHQKKLNFSKIAKVSVRKQEVRKKAWCCCTPACRGVHFQEGTGNRGATDQPPGFLAGLPAPPLPLSLGQTAPKDSFYPLGTKMLLPTDLNSLCRARLSHSAVKTLLWKVWYVIKCKVLSFHGTAVKYCAYRNLNFEYF